MILSNNDRKIKTIELINFMNHVNTKIDLADGINLVTGSSDNGKSAIMRALYSVLLDKHDSGWIRDGEKEYTVKITFMNGDTFERTKGKKNVLSMTPYGGETKTRTISPYLLKEYRNVWYMVAFADEFKQKNRTNIFKLTRIQKIEPCDETYVIDDKFNPEDYFKYSLGVFHIHGAEPIEVKLKFNRHLIPLISETKIHPSMEIISKTEEEMIVTFTVYNTIELKNKILSYGANAEVLSPKELRDEIIKIIDEAKLVYSN